MASSFDKSSSSLPPVQHEFKTLTLPPLPWPKDALEPHISKTQMEFHYEKHHRGYVDGLNAMASEDPSLGIGSHSIDQLVRTLKPGKALNFAGQVWNHTFYWNSMAPPKSGGGGVPSGKLAEAIDSSFGSLEKLVETFNTAASGHFGSGWAWLIQGDDGKLKVETTHDGGNAIREHKGKPLLACDMWEHAYYLDWKNDRKTYLAHWWSLVNWNFAEECMDAPAISQFGPSADLDLVRSDATHTCAL